jgi:hypothetical protein
MSNYWNIPGVPHKGWFLVDVIDVREDGQSEWETDYETCMMCGHDKIRYVHIVEHDEMEEQFRVGCNCAERMTNDYVNPGAREQELRNRAARRAKWIEKDWKVSRNGNIHLNKDGHHLTIFKDEKSGQYKVIIDNKFGKLLYKTRSDAKTHLFNKIEDMKLRGQW